MRSRAFALVLFLLLPAATAFAQNYAIQGLERQFRVEWEASTGRRGPVLTGYVYNNTTGYTAERVQLGIDLLDGAGQVVGSTIGNVLGTIPSSNRGYFEIRVPQAASYRVRVLSYEPVGRGT